MSSNYRRASGVVAAVALAALFGGTSVAVSQEAACDVPLTVRLEPGVPDVTNTEFLSSLLNRHVNYRLELLRQDNQDPSVVELELTGPGPEYRCQTVIETMRRDARVQSIRVESTRLASRS